MGNAKNEKKGNDFERFLGFLIFVLACSDFRLLILIKYCCGYFEVRERKKREGYYLLETEEGELGGAVAARGEGKALMSWLALLGDLILCMLSLPSSGLMMNKTENLV